MMQTENIEQTIEWLSGIIPTDVYQAAQVELAAIKAVMADLDKAVTDMASVLVVANQGMTSRDAEIADLRAKYDAAQERNRQLEAGLSVLTDEGYRQAERIHELEQQNRLERIHAGSIITERNDLRAKLDAAHTELHELRIRAGSGHPEPNWSQAPEWATWWAVDDNGESYWFDSRPKCNYTLGYWGGDVSSVLDKAGKWFNWASSLRQRPQAKEAAPQ